MFFITIKISRNVLNFLNLKPIVKKVATSSTLEIKGA